MWKNNGYADVLAAVQAKTGGKAAELENPGNGADYVLQNADVAAAWLSWYAKNGTPITIVGDYDCDGVCASAIAYLALKAAGANDVRVRLPRRMSEGYGLSAKIIDEIQGGVVLTVDNGIAALDAISKAKEKGLVVIVTDHHLPAVRDGKVVLPNADLIVDAHVDDDLVAKSPKRGSGYEEWCGAGVAYKIAELMLPGNDAALDCFAAFAALATVADVVSLTGDNRLIWRRGVKAMAEGKGTAGLNCLVDSLMTGGIVTEGDVEFKIGPMLNAPGRIHDDGAQKALATLLASDWSTASNGVAELTADNETRKALRDDAVARAVEYVERLGLATTNPIVVFDPQTPEGVVGLVAGALTEKYGMSSFCFTRRENGGYKGSARGRDDDDLKAALDEAFRRAPELFAGYGGHAKAAGVSLSGIAGVEDAFAELMADVMPDAEAPSDDVEYDVEVDADDLASVMEQLDRFAPYGEGNPKISFRVNGFRCAPDPRTGSHFIVIKDKFIKLNGQNGLEAIGFSMKEKYEDEGTPKAVDLIGWLGWHAFRGMKNPQVEVEDFEGLPDDAQKSDLAEAVKAAAQAGGLFAPAKRLY